MKEGMRNREEVAGLIHLYVCLKYLSWFLNGVQAYPTPLQLIQDSLTVRGVLCTTGQSVLVLYVKSGATKKPSYVGRAWV